MATDVLSNDDLSRVLLERQRCNRRGMRAARFPEERLRRVHGLAQSADVGLGQSPGRARERGQGFGERFDQLLAAEPTR